MAQTHEMTSDLVGKLASVKGLGWQMITGLGIIFGLAAWTLLIGWGLRQQYLTGDWITVALLALWLFAPYLASLVYVFNRLDLFENTITMFAQYYAIVLFGSLWVFFWAGKSLWLQPIGQQLASGKAITGLVRIGFLVLPIFPLILYWRLVGEMRVSSEPDSTV